MTQPPQIPAHLECVRHLKVRGLGEEEAGQRAQEGEGGRDQEGGAL